MHNKQQQGLRQP